MITVNINNTFVKTNLFLGLSHRIHLSPKSELHFIDQNLYINFSNMGNFTAIDLLKWYIKTSMVDVILKVNSYDTDNKHEHSL